MEERKKVKREERLKGGDEGRKKIKNYERKKWIETEKQLVYVTDCSSFCCQLGVIYIVSGDRKDEAG